LGDTVTMARVRGVIAAASAGTSSCQSSRTATGTGTQPAMRIAISWLK
jgi:hypothetical protein